jgi:hypothetical protein
MVRFADGDTVQVTMPRGYSKRGVLGISVLYTTSPEARFDGAVGTVTEINPRGTLGIPLYLVDFRDHDNRVAIPWQSQWFREEWLAPAGSREAREKAQPKRPAAEAAGLGAASGQGRTTVEESS